MPKIYRDHWGNEYEYPTCPRCKVQVERSIMEEDRIYGEEVYWCCRCGSVCLRTYAWDKGPNCTKASDEWRECWMSKETGASHAQVENRIQDP